MTNNKSKEPSVLDHLRGTLVTMFGLTPIGAALGFNPILRNPLVQIGINETSKDTVRDVGLAYKYLTTLGDKQAANTFGDGIEQAWRKNITKNIGLGESEFRLGAGWKLPSNTLYNGKINKDQEGKALPMDAVFLRHKGGKIEVLDHNDSRYLELAMPYVVGQIAIPIGAGKAMGAIKLLANGGKIVDGLVKGADYAGKAVSAVNTAGGLGYAGALAASNFVLKPEAISTIGHMYDDPKKLTPEFLRKELNKVFEQYSYLNGPMAEQYFVPALKDNEDPFKRFHALSTGFVHGAFESANPFDRITDLSDKSKHFRQSIKISEANEKIDADLDFRRGFLKLAQKNIAGANLSTQELILLNFGLNIYTGSKEGIVPAKGEEFSVAEKAKIKTQLHDALEGRFFPEEENISGPRLNEKISSELKDLDSDIAKRDKPKNPLIQNRIDSPFVLG